MRERAIAEHAWANDHPINWAETKVLRANRAMDLVLKESLSIRTTSCDSGNELPDCWITEIERWPGQLEQCHGTMHGAPDAHKPKLISATVLCPAYKVESHPVYFHLALRSIQSKRRQDYSSRSSCLPQGCIQDFFLKGGRERSTYAARIILWYTLILTTVYSL